MASRVMAQTFNSQAPRNMVHKVKSWPEIFDRLSGVVANKQSHEVGLYISSRAVVRVTDPVFNGPVWRFLQKANISTDKNWHRSLFFLGDKHAHMKLRSEEMPEQLKTFSSKYRIYPHFVLASSNPFFTLQNAPAYFGGTGWTLRRESFLKPIQVKHVVVYVDNDKSKVELFNKREQEVGNRSVAFHLECPPERSKEFSPDIFRRLQSIYKAVKALPPRSTQEEFEKTIAASKLEETLPVIGHERLIELYVLCDRVLGDEKVHRLKDKVGE